MPKTPAHRLRRRPHFFHPVPLRARCDGWSEAGQCAFLAALYFSGSVTAAARGAGMTRWAAYRLRTRRGAESFAHAWDRVLMPPGSGQCSAPKVDWRKVTDLELLRRVEAGLVQPAIYRGKMVGIRRKADISGLLRLLQRGDTSAIRSAMEGLGG